MNIPETCIVDRVPRYPQQHDVWCGPACIDMIAAKFGIEVTQSQVAQAVGAPVSDRAIVGYLRSLGLKVHESRRTELPALYSRVTSGSSVILLIGEHYVILIGESRKNWIFADPESPTLLGYVPKKEIGSRWNGWSAVVTGKDAKTLKVNPL